MCSDECLGFALIGLRLGAEVEAAHRAAVRRGRKLASEAGTRAAADVPATDFGAVLDGVAGRCEVTD